MSPTGDMLVVNPKTISHFPGSTLHGCTTVPVLRSIILDAESDTL